MGGENWGGTFPDIMLKKWTLGLTQFQKLVENVRKWGLPKTI